ncbi:unnamed protein product [Lathyrus oleraceus]
MSQHRRVAWWQIHRRNQSRCSAVVLDDRTRLPMWSRICSYGRSKAESRRLCWDVLCTKIQSVVEEIINFHGNEWVIGIKILMVCEVCFDANIVFVIVKE